MKRYRPPQLLVALCGLACLVTTGTAATQEPEGRLAARPVSPQEIKDYALPSTTQTSGGLFTVGIGQPVHLEAQVLLATTVSNVVWNLESKPSSSTAELAASPLPTDMPIYNPGDREVNKVAERMLLVPDKTGVYKVSVTLTTDVGELVFSHEVTCATFVGVGTVADANPVFPQCALCHADKAAGWDGTLHSVALSYNLDDASGHFSSRCLSCHTTGFDAAPAAVNNGFDDIATLVGWTFPATLGPGNWDAVPAQLKAVSNVQCESCHGPGSEHFGQFNRTSVSTSSGDCAQCHDSTSHHNKNQEWNHSRHAVATRYPTGEGREACVACHSGIGFIDKVDGATAIRTEYEAVVCSTCHDPHDHGNAHQVRTMADVPLADGTIVTRGGTGKLCMNCHQGRREAKSYVDSMGSVSSSFGAHHGPQADMLAGKNAYDFDHPLRSSGHTFAVEESCVTCHLQEVAAGSPGFLQVGGHTFKPGWDGGTPDDPSDDVHLTEACSECHGEMESFDSLVRQDYDGNGVAEGTQTEIKGLLNKLAMLLPPYGSTTVTPSNAYTHDERGALWNYMMVLEDGSYGVHNTMYAADMLKTSIAILGGQTTSGDVDDDCLPDEWEVAQFGSITLYTGKDDPDGDKVTNSMEYAAQTKPLVADSDGDGFSDWDELHVGTNPNSADDSPELGRTQIFTAAEMVFATEAGKNYQIQSLDSLGNGAWADHGDPFTGTGEMMQLFISTRQTEKSFYRVVELP